MDAGTRSRSEWKVDEEDEEADADAVMVRWVSGEAHRPADRSGPVLALKVLLLVWIVGRSRSMADGGKAGRRSKGLRTAWYITRE